jgi:hypothetical protein
MFDRALRRDPDDERRTRLVDATPVARTSAMLELQRGAGNAAVARMLNPGGRTVSRVGEKKVSVADGETYDPSTIQLLREALEDIRKAHSAEKSKYEVDTLASMPPGKDQAKARQATVLNEYPTKLKIDKLARLKEHTKFKDAKLELGAHDDKSTTVDVLLTGKVVAKLVVGRANFMPKPVPPKATAAEGESAVEDEAPAEATPARGLKVRIGKPDKEYVDDDRGVETRRFAYVEKSYYQFMELVATGVMTGRYQVWHQALSLSPNLKSVAPYLASDLTPVKGTPLASMTTEQMAVLHQWKGSGPQQRGLSLTSTPRVKAVFGNSGESFASDDGVRIKIDLSLVPQTVILLNHYADGGVKDNPGVNPRLMDYAATTGHGSKYSYGASVRKNRELLPQELKPEWIVGIEAHNPDKALSAADALKTGKELVQAVAKQTGFDSYVDAFNKTITALSTNAKPPDPKGDTDKAFDKGIASATKYMDGHTAGKTEFALFKKTAEATGRSLASKTAARKRKSDFFPPEPGTTSTKPTLSEIEQWAGLYACNQIDDLGPQPDFTVDTFSAMNLLSGKREDKKPIHWIGWAHGAARKKPQPMDAQFYGGTTETV